MDFIERWLGISPDGGSGSFELLIVGGLLLVVVTILTVRSRTGSRDRRR